MRRCVAISQPKTRGTYHGGWLIVKALAAVDSQNNKALEVGGKEAVLR